MREKVRFCYIVLSERDCASRDYPRERWSVRDWPEGRFSGQTYKNAWTHLKICDTNGRIGKAFQRYVDASKN